VFSKPTEVLARGIDLVAQSLVLVPLDVFLLVPHAARKIDDSVAAGKEIVEQLLIVLRRLSGNLGALNDSLEVVFREEIVDLDLLERVGASISLLQSR
jgi:hypothetical protein